MMSMSGEFSSSEFKLQEITAVVCLTHGCFPDTQHSACLAKAGAF
jgi:hypothetical protein